MQVHLTAEVFLLHISPRVSPQKPRGGVYVGATMARRAQSGVCENCILCTRLLCGYR